MRARPAGREGEAGIGMDRRLYNRAARDFPGSRIAMAELFEVAKLTERQASLSKAYLEFLRVPALSAGIYVLPAGASDPQKPHSEDELYYVVRGRARFLATEDFEVRAGSLIFVKANEEHRFHSITEELVVLVFFAPAESG